MKSTTDVRQTTSEEKEDVNLSQKYDPITGISEFRKMVLAHYSRHGRLMPWRDNLGPYSILVSEIMLQQTQVERVLTKYPEFLAAFPDFATLAKAPLADILSAWQGMGYNRRAIALQKCAQRVMNEFNGILPEDADILATFPGIGCATASSICAFAFNQPVVFIETNIRRIFIHFFFPAGASVTDAEILPLVHTTLYIENPRVWYWALMDLGSSLKKTVVNPNRRSAHYTKQSAFEGSDRRIRGRIIALLLKTPALTRAEIAAAFNEDADRIFRIICVLENEGFIHCMKDRYSLVS
ncbi:MAG: A/G-specific adenine glycosylase [Methanoregula sp.]|nr:A/G-specific adenine glycosylase [Methanoregula sp.]